MKDNIIPEIVGSLEEQIHNLHGAPYRSMVIYGSPKCGKSALAKEVSKRNNLCYINFLEEVLISLNSESIETYDRRKLINFIQAAVEENNIGVVFDELDSIFATWENNEVHNFFAALRQIKVKFPVIIITSQCIDFNKMQFDSNRLYSID